MEVLRQHNVFDSRQVGNQMILLEDETNLFRADAVQSCSAHRGHEDLYEDVRPPETYRDWYGGYAKVERAPDAGGDDRIQVDDIAVAIAEAIATCVPGGYLEVRIP